MHQPTVALRIGHINLRVANLDRAVSFYCAVLGFRVARRRAHSSMAFLSCNSEQAFDVGLVVDPHRTELPITPQQSGLDHLAIVYPDRQSFVRAYQRLVAHDIAIDDAREHGFAESIYFADPDGNGIEIYWEYPRNQWPMEEDGQLGSRNTPLDLEQLLIPEV